MWLRFQELLNNCIKKITSSAKGKIHVSGRDTYDYIYGDHRATIYVELLTGRIKRRICVWSIRKWNPPYDGEIMTQQEKDEVLLCMRAFLDKKRISYDLLEESNGSVP